MYEVFSAEVLNQVQEPQFNIVKEKIAKKKTKRQQYQNYSEKEKDRAIQTIPESTLKSWVKAVKEASRKEETLEVDNAIEEQPKKNQHLHKLKEEHQVVDTLSDKIEGFSISKSDVDKHLKESCTYTLGRITKIPANRSPPDVIELRSRAVEAWIKNFNISFMQNCIFIDESGFNLMYYVWEADERNQ
ncbi:hypothetical protein CU097_004664 [Rhizopus azygosporus]|uniref:Uncharacterized protein n=1 Tax=Rhizopus azygosporus TaxID=86630 RepID=A0A367IU84_RHIAZ|nr:hypothetical protein CU097_004664 [Rhizopus azygosporus]